jgi:hypothetical protein
VPDSAKLGGHSASAFEPAGLVSTSGFVKLPAGSGNHVLLVRPPLTWLAKCTMVSGNPDIDVSVKATAAATFSAQTDTDFGHQIAKGQNYPLDVFRSGSPLNSTLTYSVVGADHLEYAGAFTIDLGLYGVPCSASVNAVG